MSFRQFTWWRRFHKTFKLPKDQKYQGYSDLLQRIEFGEYEPDQLGDQAKLEEVIFAKEVEQIRKDSPWSTDYDLEDKIVDRRKLKNKRVAIMMEKHLQKEQELLYNLAQELSKEFHTPVDQIQDFMAEFDGTTRHLYFALRAIAHGKEIPTADQVDMTPRIHQQQPRHIMRKKETKYWKLWVKVVKDNKIWDAYGINY